MRYLILGADGYLGWPLCMFLSNLGHEVVGVDNYYRRQVQLELDCESLIPNPNLIQRARRWQEITGRTIHTHIGDATDYHFLLSIFTEYRPHGVVHLAEQPSAPYSMINRDRAADTLTNNLVSTLNVAHAVKNTDPDCQIVKIGTMGEYGTPNIDIEEDWLEIEHRGRKDTFLFPRQGSSLYHTTKVQDTDLLWFYVRTWGLRVTDLMQGPVYGVSTDETNLEESLLPNFQYDEIFGTVLNRFIVQALGHYPLTIFGKGTQTRGFLNIRDSLQCMYLALSHPADRGQLRIFNQMVELFSVNELAQRVKQAGAQRGYDVQVNYLDNPRVEKEEHYYNPKYTGLLQLGLKPNYLTEDVLVKTFEILERYKSNIKKDSILRGIKWR